MADQLTQQGKRLKIDTVLNGRDTDNGTVQSDPLLLLSVEGTEGFSKPFSYTVKLWRSPVKKPFLDADRLMKLINTPVTMTVTLSQFTEGGAFFRPGGVDFNFSDEDPKTQICHIERSGVFEDIKDEGFVHNEAGAALNAFFQYSATIVPAFKMLTYETAFRVFENKNVIEIITNITQTNTFPSLDVVFDPSISAAAFPKMPYCVQYQESTYNFLSRLMNRFGIWYYFDHNRNLKGNAPHKSSMIIGTEFPAFPPCKNNISSGPRIALDRMVTTLREPSPTTIRDFGGMFHPAASRFQKGGDFNPLDPTSPYEGEATIIASRDLLKQDGKTPDVDRFRKEEFHIPVVSDTEATRYAEVQMESAEPMIATFHGSTRNPAFLPGFTFDVVGDETTDSGGTSAQSRALSGEHNQISGKSDVIVFDGSLPGGEGGRSQADQLFTRAGTPAPHLIIFVKFGGSVTEYFNTLDFLDQLKAGIFPKGTSPADVFANFTNQGLNNYLQNQLPLSLGQPPSGPSPQLIPFVLGGGIAGVAALIPLIVKLLQDDDQKSEFHCSFSAISLAKPPLGDDTGLRRRAPLPTDWVRSFARGPHLAVVIGRDGIDNKKGDIFADRLGRIRVRFPWDRRPGEKPGDQFKRGDNTCWVRVSEGWAGRRFGTQFLPRIGQEVIVDFLDGDPDRPIVTGRVYNADRGDVNLAFPNGQKRPQFGQKDLLNETPDSGSSDFRFNGIKTSSVPTDDPEGKPLPARFHLLRFDDTRDKEQYLIRSQHRLDITAFDKRFESIGSDRHLTVGGKKPPPPGPREIGGSYFAKVFKHYHLHVGDPSFPDDSGNRFTRIEQNDEIAVVQDSLQDIGGNWSTNVGGQMTVNALKLEGTIVLNASFNITLMVGPSSIVITPLGISITAPVINLVAPGILSTTPVVPVGAAPLPPGIPIPPFVTKPTDPTPADPGDTLTPPE